MARTPPQYAQLMDEPTIIVDPSLYLPPPRTALGLIRDVAFGTARGVVVAMLAGATIFSVAHVLKYQTLTHGLHDHHAEAVELGVRAAKAAPALASAVAGDLSFTAKAAAQEAPPEPAVTPVPVVVHHADAVAVELLEERLDARAQAPVVEPLPVVERASAEDLMARVRDGRRALNNRRYDEAERAFRSVLEQRSGHPAALAGLAKVSMSRGQLDQAQQFAERAVQSAPYQASYHLVLGDVLRASGNSAGAQTEYDLAGQLRPGKGNEGDRAIPPNPFAE
jgi:tetratricopeptide (TPR) repeat protein